MNNDEEVEGKEPQGESKGDNSSVKNEHQTNENLVTKRENNKEETEDRKSETKESSGDISHQVKEENSTEGKDKMTLKMEECAPKPSGIKAEKSDHKDKTRPKKSETPPLKRLMRQDPLPLFMHDKGPSPPKKIFRDELYAKSHHIPYLASAHASFLKHVPTHPKQAMLKAKHYSNKLYSNKLYSNKLDAPFIPFSVPKVVVDDQPLDLSKKGSNKSNTDYPIKELPIDTKKSPGKYTNGFLSNVGHSNSSLQSLQRKFGDFSGKAHRRPMSGMLVNIPPSFLTKSHNSSHFSSQSLNSMCSDSSKKPQGSQSSPNHSTNKGERKAENSESSESGIRRKSPHNTDLNSNLMSKSEESTSASSKEDSSKYTIHKCSCQKTYNTLYGLSLHLQETGHLPAGTKQASLMEYPKLVRGQDMWLNQESEQTKRILRCIQCGESFKSLPMLTVHMMQTQHYTKIVSSEHGRRAHKCSAYCDRDMDRECIFKCKVCNGAFNDMEGLANHMILSGHHKKHVLRTHSFMDINLKGKRKRYVSGDEHLDVPGPATVASLLDYKRKCLRDSASPVSNGHSRMSESPSSDVQEDSRITCENCGERIDTGHFVDHVRECLLHSKYEPVVPKVKVERDEEEGSICGDVEKCLDPSRRKMTASDDEGKNERKPLKLQMKFDKQDKDEVDEEAVEKSEKEENMTDGEKVKIKLEAENTDEESKEDSKAEDSDVQNKLLTPKKLDIIDPDAVDEPSKDGNSALQAMESFIQRSFSSKFNYRRNSGRFLTQDHMQTSNAVQIREKKDYKSSPVSMMEKYQKYFGDMYRQDVEAEKAGNANHAGNRHRNSPEKDDLGKLEKMCEKVKREDSTETGSENKTSDSKERPDSAGSGVSGEVLSNKYLNVEDEKEENAKKDATSSSALDSLSSFVYGQPLTSEHPLDSLQKLLTKSSIPKLSSAHSMKCIPRTPTPDAPFPLNLCLKKDPDDETDSLEKECFSDQDSNSESENEANVEYRCAACSRHFASKGSYRYHLSRCHLSSVKKYGIKEAFNMSPYIYLPLDHTAKFSKYYEMAQELANKGK